MKWGAIHENTGGLLIPRKPSDVLLVHDSERVGNHWIE
jgi:hypothetical protein